MLKGEPSNAKRRRLSSTTCTRVRTSDKWPQPNPRLHFPSFFSSLLAKKKITSYCLRCPGNGIAVGMFRIAKPKQMCSRYLVTSRKKLMKLFLKKIGHIVHLDHWTPWKIHRQPICRVFYLKKKQTKSSHSTGTPVKHDDSLKTHRHELDTGKD